MTLTMPQVETLFFMLVAVTGLVLLARRLAQPYPIFLVLGGLLLGFLPALPDVELKADVVFLIFLPPLLYVDSLNTSWRDFRNDLRAILQLAIGLVVVTAVAVAAAAHAIIPGMTWPAAFVLGAVVAPTDTVAIGAIAKRIALPRRVIVILQGESLVNDASAIVIYRIALAVALGGAFSAGHVVGSFLAVGVGGLLMGLGIGWLIGRLRLLLPDDPSIENTVSLLTPLAAYLPADALHVSGVLSVVACGIYLGRQSPRVVSSQTRLQGVAMWQMITFLLNGLLFLLVGMQLHPLVQHLPPGESLGRLIVTALAISGTVILVRFAWVFPATYLPRMIPAIRQHDPFPSWRTVMIVAWSGMRGGISLAVAASIPTTLMIGRAGAEYPARILMLLITFGVIFVTLVGQGLTLPWLIRMLKIGTDDCEETEERAARDRMLTAAASRLEALKADGTVSDGAYQELNHLFEKRRKHLNALSLANNTGQSGSDAAQDQGTSGSPFDAYWNAKRELIRTQRAVIVGLRDADEIGDETLRRILHELDLEEAQVSTQAR